MNGKTKWVIAFFVVCILLVICIFIGIFYITGSNKRERELIQRAASISSELGSLKVGAGRTIEELERKLERERIRFEEERRIAEETESLDSRERERIDRERESFGDREGSIQEIGDIIRRLSETISRHEEIDKEIMAGNN